MNTLTEDQLQNRFNYHAPDKERAGDHAFIRHECLKLASAINELCESSYESREAIQCVELAMFWANAAIARHERRDNG
jgi:hypothetical protein